MSCTEHGRDRKRPHSLFRRFVCCMLACLLSSAAIAQETEQRIYRELDLPGVEHPMVKKIRDEYMTEEGIQSLTRILDNGEPYRLYIRRRLKELGLPICLEFLPVLESSYRPAARSTDGHGLGMWQFMPNSTYPFLVRNDWVDERLDPWKETEAAFAKLQDNYRMFNDWLLAIGAYNCGAGAMSRALQASPEKTFWYLAEHNMIPAHTIRYVPKLLAISDIVINGGWYGVNTSRLEDMDNGSLQLLQQLAGTFDYVTVRTSVSLRALASELRIDEDLLGRLNAALIRGATPPDAPYQIRVPTGMGTAALDALSILMRTTGETTGETAGEAMDEVTDDTAEEDAGDVADETADKVAEEITDKAADETADDAAVFTDAETEPEAPEGL